LKLIDLLNANEHLTRYKSDDKEVVH